MFKFKCNGGRHFEDGECIMAGDIFESNKELHKAFPDRFELIQELVSKDVQNVVQGLESPEEPKKEELPIIQEEPKKQTVQRGRPRKQ